MKEKNHLVRKHAFCCGFKRMAYYKNELFVLSAFDFTKIVGSVQTTYNLCGFEFLYFYVTEEYFYFASKDTIFYTKKNAFKGFDTSPLHKIYTIDTFHVHTSYGNILYVATNEKVELYDGPVNILSLKYNIDIGLVVAIKVKYKKMFLVAGSGEVYEIEHNNKNVCACAQRFFIKRELVRYVENEWYLFAQVFELGKTVILKISKKKYKEVYGTIIEETVHDMIIYKNLVILHMPYCLLYLSTDMKVIFEQSEYFEITQVVLKENKLFVGYEFGLIEEIDLDKIKC